MHPNGGLSMDVPVDWSVGRTRVWDIRPNRPRVVTGPALGASLEIATMDDWRVTSAIIGASKSLAEEFDIAGVGGDVALRRTDQPTGR